jgi:thiamine-monophosphate kinase
MRLNDVGFVLEGHLALHPEANALAVRQRIPTWMLLAGLHGEFELLFTVSDRRLEDLSEAARSIDWVPIPIGRVSDEPGVRIQGPHGMTKLDTARIRNLFADPVGDIQTCIRRLATMEESCTH